jgi:hypothetical protein
MRRTRGLSTRLVVAIGLLAALHATVFAVLLVTLHDLGTADRTARAAGRISQAAGDTRIALAQRDAPAMRLDAAQLATAGRAAGVPAAGVLANAVDAAATAPGGPPTVAAASALD